VWQTLGAKVTDDEPSGALKSYVVSMQEKNYMKKELLPDLQRKLDPIEIK
jgi:hypothetical protein